MASNYSLRSSSLQAREKKSKRPSERVSPNKHGQATKKERGKKSLILSPTLFKKFEQLATETPTKLKAAGNGTSTLRKRARFPKVSQEVSDKLKFLSTVNELEVVELAPKPTLVQDDDFKSINERTPERDQEFLVPQSAPSKLQDPGCAFEIWEDKNIDDTATMEIHSEEKYIAIEEKENNHIVEEPFMHRVATGSEMASSSNETRSALNDVTETKLIDYDKVMGQSFTVNCSPTSFFYGNKRPPSFFSKFRPGSYSKDIPPPSKSTRTLGSEHYRVNTINVFGKKPKFSTLLDALSPTTPMRVPTHLHSSRLSRRIFPLCHPLDQISHMTEEIRSPKKSVFNSSTSLKEFIKNASPFSSPTIKEHIVQYDLRPRPTPKPSSIVDFTYISNDRVPKKKLKK